MYARSVDDETWARSVTRSRFVDVSLPIEPRGRFTKRHTRRTLTIFCSSTRNARTMRSRTAPADMTPPYARETLFLFLAMCLRLYFCVAQRGTCRTKRTNTKKNRQSPYPRVSHPLSRSPFIRARARADPRESQSPSAKPHARCIARDQVPRARSRRSIARSNITNDILRRISSRLARRTP